MPDENQNVQGNQPEESDQPIKMLNYQRLLDLRKIPLANRKWEESEELTKLEDVLTKITAIFSQSINFVTSELEPTKAQQGTYEFRQVYSSF